MSRSQRIPLTVGRLGWVPLHRCSQHHWADRHLCSRQTALAALAFLCLASLPPIRRLSHEFFYMAHIVAAILMLAACYDHFDGLLGSWSYLHAAVVLLGVAFVHRLAAIAYISRFFTRPETATIELGGDGAIVVRISIRNAEMKWSAGQHVFVRFLTLQPWQTHPFTIASLDASTTALSSTNLIKREMKFIIRPHAGLTARLADLAASSSPSSSLSLRVLLDGPYGPATPLSTVLAGSRTALLVAGGTGISFVLPLLRALVEGTNEIHAVRHIKLVWAVRSAACVEWVREDLERVIGLVGKDKAGGQGRGWAGVETLEVDVSVTRAESSGLAGGKSSSSAELGENQDVTPLTASLGVQTGRPDIANAVDMVTRTTRDRLAVVGAFSLLVASPSPFLTYGFGANSVRTVVAPPRHSQRGCACPARHRPPRLGQERIGRGGAQRGERDCVLGGEVRPLSRSLSTSFFIPFSSPLVINALQRHSVRCQTCT